MPTVLSNVRFSNRPFGVKRFQTIRTLGVDVARGLVLLFGIGTKALVWGFLCLGVGQGGEAFLRRFLGSISGDEAMKAKRQILKAAIVFVFLITMGLGTVPVSAEQADIGAIYKRLTELYSAGNYDAALI